MNHLDLQPIVKKRNFNLKQIGRWTNGDVYTNWDDKKKCKHVEMT
jgi:hypothetical protein